MTKMGLAANNAMVWRNYFEIHAVYTFITFKMKLKYYAKFLESVQLRYEEKTIALTMDKVLFHQDNVIVHTFLVALVRFDELGYDLLHHPPYSPDLVP